MRGTPGIKVYHIVLKKPLIEVSRKAQYIAERGYAAHFDMSNALCLFLCSLNSIPAYMLSYNLLYRLVKSC